MKKYLLILVAAWTALFGFKASAQNDTWSGNLAVQGVKLPLLLHLDKENPTMDSPAQGAKGIPIRIDHRDTDSIAVSIPMIGATFKGEIKGDSIIGNFTQRGLEFPLILTRGERIANRPQTPRPPFPYLQEEVSFTSGDAILKGTLTLPENYNPDTPALIMVTGSGLQNRDEEILDHKPFAVIADALARNGIATLRYDDRGFGESSGDAVNCTTEDLKNDALAGINLLRQKFNRVGALGHSEGGTISLMLAAEGKVDYSVSLAGMAVSGRELLLDQNRQLLSRAYPDQVVDEYCKLLELAFDGDESLLSKLEKSGLPADLKQNLRMGLPQLGTPYMRYFLALDIRDRLQNIPTPVLALNGNKDTQVNSVTNLEALRKGLPTDSRNKIVEMEGLNHMMQHCTTGSTTEYGIIEETISPEVLEIISRWINSL